MKLENDAINALGWLDDKQDSMLKLIVELCDINSGTFNLDGLEKVRARLVEEFSALGGELNIVDSNPWMTVDDRGESEEGKSGPILHITKWPDAKSKVMLCIHMDTVYGADHHFQKCVTRDDLSLIHI